MTIHILSDRRFPFSGSSLAAVPLLPRSGFVQCAHSGPPHARGTVAGGQLGFDERVSMSGDGQPREEGAVTAYDAVARLCSAASIAARILLSHAPSRARVKAFVSRSISSTRPARYCSLSSSRRSVLNS